MDNSFRLSSQYMLPATKPVHSGDGYDIYPVFNAGNNCIFRGISSLASVIAGEKTVVIDGYAGVFFDRIKEDLHRVLTSLFGLSPVWINTSDFFKSTEEINTLLEPFLGWEDPLFGKRSTLSLSDYFRKDIVIPFADDPGTGPIIIYGIGASLYSQKGLTLYFDLPKNELQFRSRAGSVTNIGLTAPTDPKSMYKRFYFADWVSLNRHKCEIAERIDIIADAQRPDDITWMTGSDFREALGKMSKSVFRVRPWFEPGAWGGSWIKDNIQGLPVRVPNYAWSFELITPENGLILESSGNLLECSFDFLMYQNGNDVLGDCYSRFGYEFPIRFDFLDTFDGGNLSVQVHPGPDYIKSHFGEHFTQEETYYILDTKNNASVYLGFNAGIDRDNFRDKLEESYSKGIPLEIENYVQALPAAKHDLFLIPYGTIHGSGKNNLVLEISSTPYIFTFKLYDWLRPDLDGNPRPLNIKRGIENLDFGRNGEVVGKELISCPVLLKEGDDWQLFHLPTHRTHLYDVHRYHFKSSVEVTTGNKFMVLSLVEGTTIRVTTGNGAEQRFSYAETFVIPAAAGSYKMYNESTATALVVVAFVK